MMENVNIYHQGRSLICLFEGQSADKVLKFLTETL